MLDVYRGRPLLVLGLAMLAVVVAANPVQAQQQLGNREDNELKFNSTLFNSLRDGTVQFDPKAHKALVEQAAQWLVYPVTWKTYQADRGPSGLFSLRKRFGETMTAKETVSGKNRAFMKPLAHALIGCFKQVLDLPFDANQQAVTCAVLMLQDFGKCRQEEVHDFLMELTKPVKDNQYAYSPFIRMCAIRGLGEFSNPNWAAVDDKNNAPLEQVNAKLKRDVERINRIGLFVSLPYAPQGSSQEHQDAFIFIRREGIRALAQAQVPAYSGEAKKEVQGPAAYYLLYIASGGKFVEGTPALTLLEKTEAVLGLCNMKLQQPETTVPYNPEFSVYAAALCLAEFTREYNRDWAYFNKVAVKDKLAAPRQEELPWQAYAARFEDALATLAANVKGSAAATNLGILMGKLGPSLVTIKERKKQVDVEVPPALSAFAATIRPTNPDIYPGTKASLKLEAPK
jgi:hypothetical protein